MVEAKAREAGQVAVAKAEKPAAGRASQSWKPRGDSCFGFFAPGFWLTLPGLESGWWRR